MDKNILINTMFNWPNKKKMLSRQNDEEEYSKEGIPISYIKTFNDE